MAHEFTDEDHGRPVRTDDGERVATVSEVEDGRASVEEEEGLTDAIKEALGWDDEDGGSGRTHELSDAAVDRVDDDGVWIRQI
ncbi:hypothetical protein [Halalkalicoccus tibetensis]|uniref:PRC-barrel domain containing protein n=1 Tax=Halalkalicoccus tibetensis TaxID=175632 RepID=A0ABD5V0V3_9EURY